MNLLGAEERAYLLKEFQGQLEKEVRLHFFRDGGEMAGTTAQLLDELAGLDPRIVVQSHNFPGDRQAIERFRIDKAPAIVLAGMAGQTERSYGLRFFGGPVGYEFGSLVEAIIDVSRGRTDLPQDIIQELQGLVSPLHIQVFVTPGCPYCPRAVRTAHKFALVNERITADMVMATEFTELANRYGITAVPYTVVNDAIGFLGALPEREFLIEVLKGVKQ
ncbi:MAG: protein disulfide oxidoreductase [Candidatus Bipolaricaulia bacterium]